MPVRRDDFRVGDVAVVVDQRLDDLARARGSEAPVRGERDDEEPARRRGERPREVAARRGGRIEIVERLGDAQVRVRVVILGELLALVAQVRLDLELRLERELEALAQRAAELLLHLLVGQIGDVPDHPGDDEPAPRLRAQRLEVTVVKIRIGADRLARHLVERDVLRGKIRRGGDHQRVADPVRIARGPRERLHAAQAAAHHRRPLPDAENIGESRLRIDPVFDGDEREIGAPGFAGGRIRRERSGRAEAAAEIVDADDEEAVGVERLAGTDHVVPPADVVGIVRVVAGDVMRRVERMAHEHRVRRRRHRACRRSRTRGRIAAARRRTRAGAARRSAPRARRPRRPSGRARLRWNCLRWSRQRKASGPVPATPSLRGANRVGVGRPLPLRFSRICRAPRKVPETPRPQAGSNRRRRGV